MRARSGTEQVAHRGLGASLAAAVNASPASPTPHASKRALSHADDARAAKRASHVYANRQYVGAEAAAAHEACMCSGEGACVSA